MKAIPQFVIAAPASGSGKTTVARGLMALLRSHGLSVQPFKCGPDYIDTKFHAAVCGRPSVNLDLFMASEAHVRELYARYSAGADVCVVEGMMGMFDGYDRDLGSAAHVARVLGLPVVLVVDARSAAYSLAPLLHGFAGFRREPRVAGVIFNKVGAGRHCDMLRQVCRDLGIECFGCLPKSGAVEQPSRYLGLDFSHAAADDELPRLIEANVEWGRLLEAVTKAAPEALAREATGCPDGLAALLSQVQSSECRMQRSDYFQVQSSECRMQRYDYFQDMKTSIEGNHTSSLITHHSELEGNHTSSLDTLNSELEGNHTSSLITHHSELEGNHTSSLITHHSELEGNHTSSLITHHSELEGNHTSSLITHHSELNEAPHIAVASSPDAFSFIYQEHLDILRGMGRVTLFDPAREPLPAGVSLLYLPGGYPERHAAELSGASDVLSSIRSYAAGGGRVLAECGGMMYLCRSIATDEGVFPMAGVLPYDITARTADRRLSLGYRRFTVGGCELRGHEFHYSHFDGTPPESIVPVMNAVGDPAKTAILRQGNVIAGYTHLYWGGERKVESGERREEKNQRREESFQRREERGERRGNSLVDGRNADCDKSISLSSLHSPLSSERQLHPIMFTGTGSDVGKSVVAAAFCRIFRQDGLHPAPFKAQNMALNSFATPEGLEIGRAQAVQAEAAGVPCHTDMNPLLLKPQSDHTSQVVLNGRPAGVSRASEYFRREGREALRAEVCAAFDRLAARYNPVVMEGAGSMTELNLRDVDLVNLPMAAHAGADVILVADIDRGGVFASVYGSIALLRPEERQMVKGVLINKFRGDISLFEPGIKIIEELCDVPVLGVIPYYKDIHIEEEDSVQLARKSMEARRGKVNVAVVLLRHLSNFTDFDALERDPRVHLFYTSNTAEIAKADIIILPGSKCTVDDLCELRRNGVAQAIVRARRDGATVLGICGGYQMMGREVLDPDHVEGDIERIPGLGLLPITTTMTAEKTTRQVRFELNAQWREERGEWRVESGERRENSLVDGRTADCDKSISLSTLHSPLSSENFPLTGYEIHMGTTTIIPPPGEVGAVLSSSPSGRSGGASCGAPRPLALLSDGTSDGCFVDDRCMGTYLHGILDNRQFVDFLLRPFAARIDEAGTPFDYAAFKNEQYDKLADHVRRNVNMELIYKIMRGEI